MGEFVKPSFFLKKNKDFHKINTLKNEETPLRKVSKIDQKINTKTDAKIIEKLIKNGAKKPSKIHLKIDRKNDAKMMPKRRSKKKVGA